MTDFCLTEVRFGTAPPIDMITSFAVTTRNRLPQLRRCIRSYAEHFRHYGHSLDLCVFDDTPEVAYRNKTARWLRSYGEQTGSRIYYAAESERQHFLQRLRSAGIHKPEVIFSHTPGVLADATPGVNRNAMLLNFAGERFISADDDSVCQPFDFNHGSQHATVLSRGAGSLDVHFFECNRAALAAAPGGACDLLAAHEGMLAKPLHSLEWSSTTERVTDIIKLGPKVAADLMAGRGHVAITMTGVIGDSGIPDNAGFLLANGIVRHRFLSLAQSRGTFCVSRSFIRGVQRPSLTARPFVTTTTCTGFDNTIALPPFLPFGTREDTLFGRLLDLTSPDRYTCFLPVGLPHARADDCIYAPPPVYVHLAEMLLSLLHACPHLPAIGQTEAYRSVQSYLRVLVDLDDQIFFEHLHSLLMIQLMDSATAARHSLRIYNGQPFLWAEELKQWITRIERLVDQSAKGHARSLPIVDAASFQTVRKVVEEFSHLLDIWPQVLSIAASLRASEVSLAQRIT